MFSCGKTNFDIFKALKISVHENIGVYIGAHQFGNVFDNLNSKALKNTY